MRPDPTRSGGLTKEVILHRLRESYPQLTAQFGVQRIGLFGSFARETGQESSDVDFRPSRRRKGKTGRTGWSRSISSSSSSPSA
jgi:hypothetical protein